MPSEPCDAPRPHRGRVRSYAFGCGRCGHCLARGRGHGLPPVEEAWLLGLNASAPATATEVDARAIDHLARDAAAGGLHDTFSRAPYRLGELGLVGAQVVGVRTTWSVTEAGELALRRLGAERGARLGEPASLFEGGA